MACNTLQVVLPEHLRDKHRDSKAEGSRGQCTSDNRDQFSISKLVSLGPTARAYMVIKTVTSQCTHNTEDPGWIFDIVTLSCARWKPCQWQLTGSVTFERCRSYQVTVDNSLLLRSDFWYTCQARWAWSRRRGRDYAIP